MSLINKMLQDLDQRGSGPSGPFAASVKLTPQVERSINWSMLAGGVVVAVLVAGAGAFAWKYYKTLDGIPSLSRVKTATTQAAPATAAPVAKPAAPMVDATGSPIIPADPKAVSASASGAPAAGAPAAAVAQSGAAPAPVAGAAQGAPTPAAGANAAQSNPVAAAAALVPAPAAKASAEAVASANSDNVDVAKAKPDVKTNAASEAKPATAASKANKAAEAKAGKASAAKAAKALDAKNKAAKAASTTSAGVALTNGQRAEAEYRRGLSALQEGRNGEAMAALEQAVRLEPTHDAARQTLVGLLVEARRPEEAMRHLQVGLTLEPRQPAMAMLLARLQIERGISGVETLMRTLPYATGNSEYHAFLAGVLARESRHQEAVEQYRNALRAAPQNGTWWIGLAISLQSEKRDGEALDAYKRAKASGSLTPELAAFADRKINALSR